VEKKAFTDRDAAAALRATCTREISYHNWGSGLVMRGEGASEAA